VWATLADGREVLVVTFAGNTAEGDTLDYSLPAPLPQVTGVRVETLQSPSWVAWQEIEVMRATEGDGAAACVVTAPGGANLRGGAGTDFALAGSLPAGRGALVDAQTTGADGFTWWHLADDVPSGIWVRADVVQAGDSCTDVPPFEGGESSQSGTVPVTFTVTAPPDTRPGDTLFLAGSFSEAGLPEWDPGALPLHASGGGQWTLTLDLPPGGVFEYKYTRGGWDTVEKGPACEELANRSLTVASQQDGQPVTDTVARWIDQGCE
jgi:hypothetical protein